MKVVVAGSRCIDSYYQVYSAIQESGFDITEIISGTADGVDKQGESYAEEHNIPLKRFPADWEKYGKKAGFIRNSEMNDNCDAVIVIWDGKSAGSEMMAKIATKSNKPVFIKTIVPPEKALI